MCVAQAVERLRSNQQVVSEDGLRVSAKKKHYRAFKCGSITGRASVRHSCVALALCAVLLSETKRRILSVALLNFLRNEGRAVLKATHTACRL